MKKSGSTIDSFLKKMQQQMGVEIIGFAAYRNNEGKLCAFEYVLPLFSRLLQSNFHIASPLRMTPLLKHILRRLTNSLESGQNGLHKRVMLADLYPVHLFTWLHWLLGAREGEDEEDEEPKELESSPWKELLDLDDDGLLSLKSWTDVNTLKANKKTIAVAFREVIRQAWSKYFLYYYFPYLTSV